MLQWTREYIHLSELVLLFFQGKKKKTEVEFLDYTVVLFLIFWGIAILCSTAAVPMYIPTACAQASHFLYILTNTCYLRSSWWSPFWQVWGGSSSRFWFSLSWQWVMWNIFSSVCWSFAMSSLEKCRLGPLFFNRVACFYDVESWYMVSS